jgi:hypothetical protein
MMTSFRERNSSTSPLGRRAASGSSSRAALAAAGAMSAAAVLLAPETASAQAAAVSVDGKGIVGGALLGAEVVDLTIGIIGVNRAWPYLVFGAVGAIGGGIGGYFIEQETRESPEGALYMLAGGMALVIPTVIVSLNATLYKPPEGTSTTTFEPADNQPAQSPPAVQPPAPTPLPAPTSRFRLRSPSLTQKAERLSFSLVDVNRGKLALSVPAVQVRPLYSLREVWTYGVEQGTEVRVPLFYASF